MRHSLQVSLAVVVLSMPVSLAAHSSSGSEDTWVAIGVEALYGIRSAPESSPLITSSASGAEIFNADAFSFGGELGGLLQVSAGFAEGWSFTAAYRVHTSFSDEPFTPAPGTVYLYGQTATAADLSITQTYESDFQDAVIDFGYDVEPWVRVHGGVRWVTIDDDLEALVSRPTFSALFLYETTNELLGLQFGADFRLWEGSKSHGQLDVVVGALRNEAEGVGVLENPPGNVASTAQDSTEPTSTMAELGFRVVWEVSSHWSLVLGVEALWIDHLAEVSSQPVATDSLLAAGPVMRLDDDGDVLHSSLAFGFDVRF